jgi:hypothetical protein
VAVAGIRKAFPALLAHNGVRHVIVETASRFAQDLMGKR